MTYSLRRVAVRRSRGRSAFYAHPEQLEFDFSKTVGSKVVARPPHQVAYDLRLRRLKRLGLRGSVARVIANHAFGGGDRHDV